MRKQNECGIDIVTDGEFSKPGFFTYIQERLEGFEARPDQKMVLFQKEVAAFPEYYAEYFKQAMMGGTLVPITPVVCVGPVKYRGEKLLQSDIANVKAAAKAAGVPDNHVFLPATAPSGVGINEYYKSDEEYFHALAAELGKEYKAIIDAGILVQIDDPFLPDIFFEPGLDDEQMKRRAQIYVEAVNRALAGHSSREGALPHLLRHQRRAAPLRGGAGGDHRICAEDQGRLLQLRGRQSAPRARISSVRAREDPDGKVLCPGVITHASNIVEHPELIAERMVRFAKLVGRENVMAGADCGFSSQALYRTEVHDTVVWEKFKAMRAGRRHRDQETLELNVLRDRQAGPERRYDPGG